MKMGKCKKSLLAAIIAAAFLVQSSGGSVLAEMGNEAQPAKTEQDVLDEQEEQAENSEENTQEGEKSEADTLPADESKQEDGNSEADAKADTDHAGTKSRDELPDRYSDRSKHNVRRAGSRHIRTGNVATGIWYPAGDATAATGTAGKCTDPTVSAATHFADTGGRTVYVYGT